ncbi:Hypothetical_protein [Hexamita inflata]|uniref:Hypothetical_protein n=1 Tax=Hexamita inflata TaxID=28002 RepID=A0AA86TPN4_9EUKA|nr:Hypothetical protein HINF_LOCUS6558 [Hexamita inflata]
MKAKYQNNINQSGNGYGHYLFIYDDLELRDLRFVSELGVTDLRLCKCQNAHALRAPANLRRFQHYNSSLKIAKGVERLVELELLYLGENQIVGSELIRVGSLLIALICQIDQIKLCLNSFNYMRVDSFNSSQQDLAYKLNRFKIVCFMSTFTTNNFCAAVHMSSVRMYAKLLLHVTTVYCCSRTVHHQLLDMLTVLNQFADQNELP